MKHPIFLELTGRPVVVLGGGDVAERKIEALLPAGARVKVVSPEITGRIRAWCEDGRMEWEPRRYESGDLAGAVLAYAATGDAVANEAVRREASARGVWLNVADESDLCDFFTPAVVRRGELVVAISTGGASPALSGRLREQAERNLSPDLADLVARLAELRARCRREGRPLSELRDEIMQMIDAVLRK